MSLRDRNSLSIAIVSHDVTAKGLTEHVDSRLSKIESFRKSSRNRQSGSSSGKMRPQLIAEKPKIMIDPDQALPSVKPFIAKTL